MKKVLKGIILSIMIAVTMAGCGGGSSNPASPGTTYSTLSAAGVPIFPANLTGGGKVAETMKALSLVTNPDSDATTEQKWGAFKIVPQISWNYNYWVEERVDADLTNFKTKFGSNSAENGKITTSEGKDMAFVISTPIGKPEYAQKVKMFKGSMLISLLYYNNDWSKWEYIVRKAAFTGDKDLLEVRDLKYEKTAEGSIAKVLYYREKTEHNMNDVVQIWHTGTTDWVTCVRAYGISAGNRSFVSFAGLTDLASTDHKTTGRLWRGSGTYTIADDSETYSSPSLFHDGKEGYYRRANNWALDIESGYPTKDAVLAVRNKAMTPSEVAACVVNFDTLESENF